jgi:hypothetical protein
MGQTHKAGGQTVYVTAWNIIGSLLESGHLENKNED